MYVMHSLLCKYKYSQVTSFVISIVLGLTTRISSAVCINFYCYLFCACSLIIVGDQWEKGMFVVHNLLCKYKYSDVMCIVNNCRGPVGERYVCDT